MISIYCERWKIKWDDDDVPSLLMMMLRYGFYFYSQCNSISCAMLTTTLKTTLLSLKHTHTHTQKHTLECKYNTNHMNLQFGIFGTAQATMMMMKIFRGKCFCWIKELCWYFIFSGSYALSYTIIIKKKAQHKFLYRYTHNTYIYVYE